MTKRSAGILGFFANHRVAANLLMVLMVLAGFWGLSKLNTQFFPNFALDIATVRVVWSGATAEDVERALTIPLEQELRSVNGLKKLSSTSASGVASLTIEFHEGTDIGAALDEVRERVARVRNLPSTAKDPEISQIIRYEPVARLLIIGADRAQLRDAVYRIRDELLERGIAKVDISGLPAREIAIEVSASRLAELGLTYQALAERVRHASQDIPAGSAGKADVALQLRGLDQQRTAQGFAQLPIIVDTQGRRTTVADIGNVVERPRDGEVALFVGGRPAVELLAQRTENADALASARILQAWLDDTSATLPESISLEMYDQSWKLINERIDLLLKNGLGGLLLVVAILYLFLNGRVAFWVAAGIPVSFLATLGMIYVFGGSINMISLFGMIMALGVIVDDAIIVAENAQSNFRAGESPEKAAENGARRMFAPVLSSSLTTIAAFLPLMLIGGIMGRIMFEIPFVVVCVVAASFVECMLVLPAHMRYALSHVSARGSSRSENIVARFRGRFDAGFERFRDNEFCRLVRLAVENRWTTIVCAVATLILAIGLIAGGRIAFTFFPGVESTIVYANASFTAGTPRDRVEAFLSDLEKRLREAETELGEQVVVAAVSRAGVSTSGDATGQRRGDQYGSMIVELVSPDQRETRVPQLIRKWQELIVLPPGIELFTVNQRTGGPPGQDLDLRLIGKDAQTLKEASLALQEKLTSYPGVSGVEDDLPWGQEQLIYELTAAGRAAGLTSDAVGAQLRAAFDGELVQVFQTHDDEVEVKIGLPRWERETLATLSRLVLVLPNGEFSPLDTLVTLSHQRGFEALRHFDGQLAVRVSGDVDRALNNANRILADLESSFLPQMLVRYGVGYALEGRAQDQKETMGDMRTGALMALALIYIVLAWVFASYSKPLVIMVAIPFGFVGAIFGHYVMGIELTILSLFGIIGLSGIVVNDSIILISFYQQIRKDGVHASDAIIGAAQARLRAVLLTSLTTIGGLAPLLFETSVQAQFLIPMAVSITFGIAFSTLVVLLVIPATLSVAESWRNWFEVRQTGASNAHQNIS